MSRIPQSSRFVYSKRTLSFRAGLSSTPRTSRKSSPSDSNFNDFPRASEACLGTRLSAGNHTSTTPYVIRPSNSIPISARPASDW